VHRLDGPAVRRLSVTEGARQAMVRLGRDNRQPAVVLSWPGGAAHLPRTLYRPGRFDVIIGHVAGCPIYADVRQLGIFARSVVLELAEPPRAGRRPRLRLRSAEGPTQAVM
jgi:hypothetical protein